MAFLDSEELFEFLVALGRRGYSSCLRLCRVVVFVVDS